MIAPSRADAVRRLLAQGLCPRAIQRATRVHRDTIARIHAGTWKGDGREEPPAFERCAGCGHRVQLPCRICPAREYDGPLKLALAVTGPLGVDLKPAHRARYDALHAQKLERDRALRELLS